MPTNVPEGFANCRFVYTLAGDLEEMSWGLGVNTVGLLDAEELAASLNVALLTTYLGTAISMYTGWAYRGTRVTLTVDGLPSQGDWNTNVSGTGANVPLPSNCAVLVRKNTAAGGRANRGRAYLPAAYLASADVSALGVIQNPKLSSLQTGFDDLLAKLEADGTFPYLFHPEPAAPTVIQSFAVQALIATQRRRLR